MSKRFVVGIDEAGRGPLAGPVAVGMVMMEESVYMCMLRTLKKRGVRDSKKLTEKKRTEWYTWMKEEQSRGTLVYAHTLVSSRIIDARGIVPSIKRGIARLLAKHAVPPHACKVLLDGGLSAPPAFTSQKTIIRGDESEPIISLASISAKVARDRYMVRLDNAYPLYGFSLHKGYGTVLHYKALRTHGLSPLHRSTFCKALVDKK